MANMSASARRKEQYSRDRPSSERGRPVAVAAASSGRAAGMRGRGRDAALAAGPPQPVAEQANPARQRRDHPARLSSCSRLQHPFVSLRWPSSILSCSRVGLSRSFLIAHLLIGPGDHCGPEVTKEAIKVPNVRS